MKYIKKKMNEMDLISTFSKEQLEKLMEIQISYENYEGARVIKSAIEQYDDDDDDYECGAEYLFGFEEDSEEDSDEDDYLDSDDETKTEN